MTTVPGKYYKARKRQEMAKTRRLEGIGTGGEARNGGAARPSYFARGGERLMCFYHNENNQGST